MVIVCLIYKVQFSYLIDWVIGGTWAMIQKRSFSSLFWGRPLWAVPAWAGMSTLWRCPSSIACADHCISHPPRCPEGWFWRGCCGVFLFALLVSANTALSLQAKESTKTHWIELLVHCREIQLLNIQRALFNRSPTQYEDDHFETLLLVLPCNLSSLTTHFCKDCSLFFGVGGWVGH